MRGAIMRIDLRYKWKSYLYEEGISFFCVGFGADGGM